MAILQGAFVLTAPTPALPLHDLRRSSHTPYQRSVGAGYDASVSMCSVGGGPHRQSAREQHVPPIRPARSGGVRAAFPPALSCHTVADFPEAATCHVPGSTFWTSSQGFPEWQSQQALAMRSPEREAASCQSGYGLCRQCLSMHSHRPTGRHRCNKCFRSSATAAWGSGFTLLEMRLRREETES
jgi:hypothetical protein